MKAYLVYYAVFFYLVQGEPAFVKDPKLTFTSKQECIESTAQYLEYRVRPILEQQPESFVTAICVGRDFQSISGEE